MTRTQMQQLRKQRQESYIQTLTTAIQNPKRNTSKETQSLVYRNVTSRKGPKIYRKLFSPADYLKLEREAELLRANDKAIDEQFFRNMKEQSKVLKQLTKKDRTSHHNPLAHDLYPYKQNVRYYYDTSDMDSAPRKVISKLTTPRIRAKIVQGDKVLIEDVTKSSVFKEEYADHLKDISRRHSGLDTEQSKEIDEYIRENTSPTLLTFHVDDCISKYGSSALEYAWDRFIDVVETDIANRPGEHQWVVTFIYKEPNGKVETVKKSIWDPREKGGKYILNRLYDIDPSMDAPDQSWLDTKILIDESDNFEDCISLRSLAAIHIEAVADIRSRQNTPDLDYWLEKVKYYSKDLPERDTLNGGFFPYLLITGSLDGSGVDAWTETERKSIVDALARYQIYDTLVTQSKSGKWTIKPDVKQNCLIHALRQGGVDESLLTMLIAQMTGRYISVNTFAKLCNECNLNVYLTGVDKDLRKHLGPSRDTNHDKGSDASTTEIRINLYKDHYFLHELTPVTVSWLRKQGCKVKDTFSGCVTSKTLVHSLMKLGRFRPITVADYQLLCTPYHKYVDNVIPSLEYHPQCVVPYTPKKKSEKKFEELRFAIDFESDTSDPNGHIPYLACVYEIITEPYCKRKPAKATFKGRGCAKHMLNWLLKVLEYRRANLGKSDTKLVLVLYAHNLTYDMKFYAHYGISSGVSKGNNFYTFTQRYRGEQIISRDSLKILPYKLAEFGSLFNLDVEKEVFPYAYYTYKNLEANDGLGYIEDAMMYVPEHQRKQFVDNVNRVAGMTCKCCEHSDVFNMYDYAEYYCSRDVEVLAKGLVTFDRYLKEALKFDISLFDFLTVSSIANKFLEHHVYSRWCDVSLGESRVLYKVGGNVRLFIEQAKYGGRCMTRANRRWHFKAETAAIRDMLCDFDAVSLYPSAMARLCLQLGKPIPFGKFTDVSELSMFKAYVVEIEITSVPRHYNFPLVVTRTDEGNANDDTIATPFVTVVDNIALEDLIRYCGIRYRIIRGYGWDGEQVPLADVITEAFNARLKYKKEGNPLQQVFKLLLNSIYGKTIEKAHGDKWTYLTDADTKNKSGKVVNKYERYRRSHYNFILEDITLSNVDKVPIHAIHEQKDIAKDYNLSLLGIQVLSMSKRIMNEVMCLAENIGCMIYYQDTDSMHILKGDVDKLAIAYERTYQRPLIGSALGQFHSDFPTLAGATMPLARESWFIGKKLYIDELVNTFPSKLACDEWFENASVKDRERSRRISNTEVLTWMIRAKGIPEDSVWTITNRQYNGDPMKLYKDLYDGAEVIFDLCDGGPCFKISNDQTVTSLQRFERKVKALTKI